MDNLGGFFAKIFPLLSSLPVFTYLIGQTTENSPRMLKWAIISPIELPTWVNRAGSVSDRVRIIEAAKPEPPD